MLEKMLVLNNLMLIFDFPIAGDSLSRTHNSIGKIFSHDAC
jgi:hypothetical protein